MKAHQTFYSSPFGSSSRNPRNTHYESHSNLRRNTIEYDLPESFMTERELRHFKRGSALRTHESIPSAPNIGINQISKLTSSEKQDPLTSQISHIQSNDSLRYNFPNMSTSTTRQREANSFITASNRRDMSVEQNGSDDVGSHQISYFNQINSHHNNNENITTSQFNFAQEINRFNHPANQLSSHLQTKPDIININLLRETCTSNKINMPTYQHGSSQQTESLQTPMNNNKNKPTKRNWMDLVDQNNIIQNPSSKKRMTRRLIHQSQLPVSPTSQTNANETIRQLNAFVNHSRKRKIPSKQAKMQQCAICLSSPENDVYGRIACTHQFCLECILQWSSITNQCPMCRKDFMEIHVHSTSDCETKKRCNRSTWNVIPVEPKKQRIPDEDEFYWEDVTDDETEDEICYICETDYDQEKLLICDSCEVRICHSYCDNELFDDSIPSGEWNCHECRLLTE